MNTSNHFRACFQLLLQHGLYSPLQFTLLTPISKETSEHELQQPNKSPVREAGTLLGHRLSLRYHLPGSSVHRR